jgi:hypothetical protein
MKRQFLAFLALTSIVAGSTTLLPTAPAKAATVCQLKGLRYTYNKADFQAWEHPFACNHLIGTMSQSAADKYCKALFAPKAVELFFKGQIPRNPHVWGHLDSHTCVYNSKK